MKKILTKIIMAITSLALIATTVTTVVMTSKYNQLNSIKNEDEIKLSSSNPQNYAGGLDILYSTDKVIDATGSNTISSLAGVTEFYMSFYFTVAGGIDGYELHFQFDLDEVDSITVNQGDASMAALDSNLVMSNSMQGGDWNANGLGKTMMNGNFAQNITAVYNPNGELILTATTGSTTTFVSPGKYLIAKALVKLKSGVSSMSAKCTSFTPGHGSDSSQSNTLPIYHKDSGNARSGAENWDTSIGAGSLSDSTVTTGTFTVGSTTDDLVADETAKTLTATIPADATGNVTINLMVEKNGTVDSVTGSGFSGTDTVTVAVPGRGNTATATVNVTAQDGTTPGTYTLKVVQKQYDDKLLTGMTIADASATPSAYTPKFTFSAGNNDTTTVNTTVQISSSTSSVKFTPTYSTTTGIQSVTVNGTAVSSSGSASGAVNVSNGSTVNVVVTAEDGTKKTYAYNFQTISSDTTLSSVTIKNQSGVVLGTATAPTSGSDTWVLNDVPYSDASATVNSGIRIEATANKSGNTVVISDTGVVSFPNTTAATSISTPTITVTDKDTKESKTWKLQVNRKKANDDNSIPQSGFVITAGSTNVTGTLSGDTFSTSTGATGSIPYGSTSVNITIKPTDPKAKVSINGGTATLAGTAGVTVNNIGLSGNPTPITVIVTAENGTPKTYTINLNQGPAPAEKGVTAIDVLNGATSLGVTGSGNNYTASTHLAYTINSVNLKVTLKDAKATWRLDSEAATVKHSSGETLPYTFDTAGDKKQKNVSVNIIVTAQDGTDNSASPYVVSWVRDGASPETGITNIGSGGVSIKDSDSTVYTYAYNDTTKTLTLDDKVPYKFNDLFISAVLKDTKCTVFTIDGQNAMNQRIITCNIGTAAQKNEIQFSITMHVEAEDGTPMNYTIKGTRAAADTDNSIAANNGVVIKAFFNGGSSAIQSATVNASGVYVLDNDLPHSATQLDITVTLPNGSKATLKIDNKAATSGSPYSYAIPSGNAAITNQLIPISITSESGAVNASVTGVQFNRKEADLDDEPKKDGSGNRLALVVTDGTNSYSGSWNGDTYTVTGVPYSVNTLYLEVDKNSPLAKLYFANETVEWDRTTTPQKSFAAGTAADTTAHDFQTTFKIKPEVGAAAVYTVKGTRGPADTTTALDKMIVYGASTNTPISQYTPSGITIAANNYYYSVKLTENTHVKFEFTCSSDTTKIEFSSNGTTYQEWKNAVATGLYDANNKIYYVKLTPESGASAAVTYTLHIDAADERNDNALLKELSVKEDATPLTEKNGKAFDTTAPDTYYYEVPFGAGTLTVTATPHYHAAKVYKDTSKTAPVLSIDVSKLTADSVTEFKYIVQAENETWTSVGGVPTFYILKIKRLKGNDDANLTDLKVMGKTVPGFTVTDSYKTYDVIVPRTATSVPFSYVGPTGATITPATPGMITITNGKGSVTIDVLSEDKTNPNQYIVNVYAADTEFGINDLHVLDYKQSITSGPQGEDVVSSVVDVKDKNGNVGYVHGTTAPDATGVYVITVPFSVSDVYLHVSPKNANAVITGDGKVTISAGSSVTRTVKITSEYGSLNPSASSTSVEYKFKIEREPAKTENRLNTLVITTNKGAIADSQCNFLQNTGPQNSNELVVSKVDPAVSYLDITATLVTGARKISINGDTSGSLTARLPFTDNEKTFTILVYSEDPEADPRTYELKVSREEVKLEDDASLTKIEILGDDNKHYDYDFALDPDPAIKNLDPHVNSVTITVTTGGKFATKVIEYEYPNGNKGTVASGSPLTVPVGTTKLTIYAKSQDGKHTTDPKINIELKKEKLGDNAELNEIEVDGTPFPNPSTDPKKPTQVYLPGGTTAVPVTADPKDPKAKVTIPGLDGDGKLPVQPGKNTVTVTVQPEDPKADPKSYVVEIYVDESTLLDTLTVEDANSKLLTMTPKWNPKHNEYEVTIPYDMSGVTIRYTLPSTSDSSLLTVTGDGYHAVSSTQTFNVVVTPKSGADAANTYKVKVIKETASQECKLLTVDMFSYPVANFNPDVLTGYVLIVSHDNSSVSITNTTCSKGATITLPTDLSLSIGSNIKTIKVTAQDPSYSREYQFEIIRADDKFDITNIRILDAMQNGNTVKDINGKEFTFNKLGGAYADFEVANTVQTVYIEITKEIYAYINIDGVDEVGSYQKQTYVYPFALSKVGATSPNKINIYSIAEILHEVPDQTTYKSPTHTISIIRHDLDGDATLKSLSVMIGGVEKIINFNPLNETYEVDEIGSATGFNIAAVPNKTTSKVLSGLGTNGYVAWPSNIGQDFSYTHTVTVMAENGKTKDYKINLSRGKGDPDEDNTIADIIIRDDQGNTHYMTFDPTKDSFDVTIPAGVKNYTVIAKTLSGSNATPFVKDTDYVVCDDNTWGQTVVHTVYATSKAGVDGKKYKINVKIEEPKHDNNLIELSVDATQYVTQATDGLGPYEHRVPYLTTSVIITAKTNDSTADIIVDNVSYGATYSKTHANLIVGDNLIFIKVVAQDGKDKIYTVKVVRAPKAPELLTLGVNEGPLLDAKTGVKVEFKPETRDYTVKLPYSNEIANVFATSATTSDTISGIGAKPLMVGKNRTAVTITSDKGVTTTYEITIIRFPEEASNAEADFIEIQEIPTLKDHNDKQNYDFDPLKVSGYEYTVDNKVKELTVNVGVYAGNAEEGIPSATYKVYGDKLHSGENAVVVVITAADGIATKVYLFNVEKELMSYEVNNKAYQEYELKPNQDKANTYELNIGKDKTSEVDFTKLIENLSPETSELKVEVISNVEKNPSQVIVSVSDGDKTDILTFNIESTGNPNGADWQAMLPFYIGLGIIVLLLVAILICVNKDKFGKITKKSEKKNDKKDKKEAAK